MQIDRPEPQPRDDGSYLTYVADIAYGKPYAKIYLDEGKSLALKDITLGDALRLAAASAQVAAELTAAHARMTAPHGSDHFYKGTCQLCGKPEDDELHAAPITDSERTCPEMNDGWHCHVKGDHGVHEDDNGDQWRTDGAQGTAGRKAELAAELLADHEDPERGPQVHPFTAMDSHGGVLCNCGRYREDGIHGDEPAQGTAAEMAVTR